MRTRCVTSSGIALELVLEGRPPWTRDLWHTSGTHVPIV